MSGPSLFSGAGRDGSPRPASWTRAASRVSTAMVSLFARSISCRSTAVLMFCFLSSSCYPRLPPLSSALHRVPLLLLLRTLGQHNQLCPILRHEQRLHLTLFLGTRIAPSRLPALPIHVPLYGARSGNGGRDRATSAAGRATVVCKRRRMDANPHA